MNQISLHASFCTLFCSCVILRNVFEEVSLNPDFFLNLSRRCKFLFKKKKSCHKSHRQELKPERANKRWDGKKCKGAADFAGLKASLFGESINAKKQGDSLNSPFLQRSNAYYYQRPELFWTYFNRLLWATIDFFKKKKLKKITL